MSFGTLFVKLDLSHVIYYIILTHVIHCLKIKEFDQVELMLKYTCDTVTRDHTL